MELFGNKKAKIQDFMERGALIVDVRSKSEFETGAISGSKNIPLQQISIIASELKKLNKPIIACCAIGVRSESAAKILKSKGIEAMNGGGWKSLNKKL